MGGINPIANLWVEIAADIDPLTKGLDSAVSHAQRSGGAIGNALSGALNIGIGAAVVGIGGLVAGLTLATKAAMDAEEGQAQLAAVIASTGGAAGVTANMANDLASSLQDVTRFEDDTILAGENLLLTFTKIGKDVFPQATETMLNMAQAMGGDVKGAAIQLGKALNDPIKGITALTRVGVTFTEAQKKMIETLVDSGDLIGAQKIILGELEVEFGNAARAAGDTFAGKLDILNHKFGDILESVGGAVIPILTTLADTAITTVIPAVTDIVKHLFTLGHALVEGTGFAYGLQGGWMALFKTLLPIVNTIKEVGAALIELATSGVENLVSFLTSPAIARGIQDLVEGIGSIFKDISTGDFEGVINTLADALAHLVPPEVAEKLRGIGLAGLEGLSNFKTWLDENGPLITGQAILLGENIKAWWDENGSTLTANADLPFNKLRDSIGGAFDAIVTKGAKSKTDFEVVVETWNNVMQEHQKDFDKVKTKITDGWNEIGRAIGRAMNQKPVDDFSGSLDKWGIKLPTSVQLFTEFSDEMVRLGNLIANALQGIADAIDAIVRGAKAAQDIWNGKGDWPGPYPAPPDTGGGGGSKSIMDGGRGGWGGRSVVINQSITYAPTVSLMDQAEAETKLMPFMRDAARAAMAGG